MPSTFLQYLIKSPKDQIYISESLIKESKIDDISNKFSTISQDLKNLQAEADSRINTLTSAIDAVKPIVETYLQKEKTNNKRATPSNNVEINTTPRKSPRDTRKNQSSDSGDKKINNKGGPMAKISKHLARN